MSKPKLVSPAPQYKNSFIRAVQEFHQEQYAPYMNLDIDYLRNNFEQYLNELERKSKSKNFEDHQVPFSVYWLVKDGEFLGKARIRPKLNEYYRNKYGNISYSIRPSARGKGYGNVILQKVLKKAFMLGLRQVLLTCKSTNKVSQKVIENQGGKLRRKKPIKGSEKFLFYYTIDL